MSEKIDVLAVRDRDLRRIFDRFKLSEKMDKGQLTCELCSGLLTWENIGALLVRGETLLVCCSVSECLEEAVKRKG